jgi:hypothetical protein
MFVLDTDRIMSQGDIDTGNKILDNLRKVSVRELSKKELRQREELIKSNKNWVFYLL